MLDLTSEMTCSVKKKICTFLHPFSSFWLVFSRMNVRVPASCSSLGLEEVFGRVPGIQAQRDEKRLTLFLVR